VLIIVGMATCGGLFAEISVYLLLQDVPWSLSLPVYSVWNSRLMVSAQVSLARMRRVAGP